MRRRDAGAAARVGAWTRWQAFRLLERLSDLRGNESAGRLEMSVPAAPVRSLWVFVSTIGELNAIDPLLRELTARYPTLTPVLITDHPHYRASYAARYPNAAVCMTRGHSGDARQLATHHPPALLVVAEIPCLPADAPCRFAYAFVREAKRSGAVVALVNGWLYHYAPACRMDAVERRLFERDYVRAFDALCVQTAQARDRLLTVGADPKRVSVVGNIKFDAMLQADWQPAQARSPQLVTALLRSARPTIVAGSVTSLDEQQLVLEAFVSLRGRYPSALLVLAPRHPEATDRMQALRELLMQHGLTAVFRSSIDDAPLSGDAACLVLDTMGDLRDFYAVAAVAHVGADHNVLEPLAFGKPVSVTPGWQPTYPSYPVYRVLMVAGALTEATSAAQLAEFWAASSDPAGRSGGNFAQAEQALAQARGAVDRHFAALSECLERVS
jgi:3-deoxy-D-manno-octulosonic-acid transferase